jgi:cell division protein DivIC
MPSAAALRRLLVGFFAMLFLGVGVASGVFFWQTRQEFARLEDSRDATQRKLAEVQERLREQERVLHRLGSDPAYVERVIRRRLGYARPGEFVFRFEP